MPSIGSAYSRGRAVATCRAALSFLPSFPTLFQARSPLFQEFTFPSEPMQRTRGGGGGGGDASGAVQRTLISASSINDDTSNLSEPGRATYKFRRPCGQSSMNPRSSASRRTGGVTLGSEWAGYVRLKTVRTSISCDTCMKRHFLLDVGK